MKAKLICFKWEGVARDDAHFFYQKTCEVFNRLDKKPPPPKSHHHMLVNNPGNYLDYYQKNGINIRKKALEKLVDKVFDDDIPELEPSFLDVISFLKEEDCIVGVISSKSEDQLKSEVNHYGIEDLLDFHYGGFPNKEFIIKFLIRRWEVDPDELIYIGDRDVDIEAAQDVGVQRLGKLGALGLKSELKKVEPDLELITELSELKSILNGENK